MTNQENDKWLDGPEVGKRNDIFGRAGYVISIFITSIFIAPIIYSLVIGFEWSSGHNYFLAISMIIVFSLASVILHSEYRSVEGSKKRLIFIFVNGIVVFLLAMGITQYNLIFS
jgi:hypothetical protein